MTTHTCPAEDLATPRRDEEAARTVLSPFLDGELVAWDDNSQPRMWDFCLVGEDRAHHASLEVTRNTKQSLKALNEQLLQSGVHWKAPRSLVRRWAVQLEHTAQPRRIESALFEVLKQAEDAGHSHIGSRYGMPMHQEAQEMGIWSAIDIGVRNGKVYVTAGPSGWWGDHGHVTRGMLLEAEGNEQKLRAAPPPRHLAIWVDAAAVAATIEITERGPAQDPVELPSYVDVAWAICGEADLDRAAIWRVENRLTWTVLREFSFGR